MKIAIVGESGTGKSTIARALEARFGLIRKSSGDFFRQIAGEIGVSLLEFEKLAEGDCKYDFAVDRCMTDFGRSDGIVVEGRLAAECVRDAVKILLTCDFDERCRRIASDRGFSVDDAVAQTVGREEIYKKRFKAYYGIDDFTKPKGYEFDLVIDTTRTPAAEVVEVIVRHLEAKGLLAAA